MDTIMKSQQFAKLCLTTKETLRHYDRIGLLKPVYRAENGYKMYDYFQYLDYCLITMLKEAGMPLSEIKDHIQEGSHETLTEALRESAAALDAKRLKLERQQMMIENSLACEAKMSAWLADAQPALLEKNEKPRFETVYMSNAGYRFRVARCKQEHFIDTPATPLADHLDTFMAEIGDHIEFVSQQQASMRMQNTYRIEAQHFTQRSYGTGFSLAAWMAQPIPSARLHIKPAGIYLQWLNEIDLTSTTNSLDTPNPMHKAYDALQDFALARGWTLEGDAYDDELSFYAGDMGDTIYTQVSVRINL